MRIIFVNYLCPFLNLTMYLLSEKENLCLYALPNKTWVVNLPVEEVPQELSELTLGINFARDGMQEKDLLSLVVVHNDSWLLSVVFYFGAQFGFGKSER
ncbi:PHD finger protein ALFIN-LIKE 4 [Capsicum annuum]|nr:PHD finger protein ALFIN-LIKE 4 [Capsicum annuum]